MKKENRMLIVNIGLAIVLAADIIFCATKPNPVTISMVVMSATALGIGLYLDLKGRKKR